MSRDDRNMDEHGIAWLYGCHRVGFWLGKLSYHRYDFNQVLTGNLTQHDVHGPDDSPKTIDYHHLDMSRDDRNMDKHGIDWFYGCHLVGFLLEKLLSNHCYDFHHTHTLTTNLTQHDVHGPDDSLKTIDYHHLDMSRDDGMDEHGMV
jgi:SHS2 domain-containing protein